MSKADEIINLCKDTEMAINEKPALFMLAISLQKVKINCLFL